MIGKSLPSDTYFSHEANTTSVSSHIYERPILDTEPEYEFNFPQESSCVTDYTNLSLEKPTKPQGCDNTKSFSKRNVATVSIDDELDKMVKPVDLKVTLSNSYFLSNIVNV